MLDLLDEVIANTGARIVSEQHDLGKIDGGGNASDPTGIKGQIAYLQGGGTWDQAEYGISRDAQIAKLQAADTPEAQAKAMEELRMRAVRRASLDTSNGRINVMVAVGPNGEKSPWHKLGVMVAEATSSADAMKLAGLGWTVIKEPVRWTDRQGRQHESKDTFILYRDDTGEQLGDTGSRYQPIQNADGFAFLDTVLQEFGARYETAGSVYGGKKVWMQARLPEQSFALKVNGHFDEVEAYATFFLDHTGAGADACYPVSVRQVCANTLRIGRKQGQAKGISIYHTGDIKREIANARRALGLTIQEIGQFADSAQKMVEFPMSVEELGNVVLDSVLEISQAQAKIVNASGGTALLENVVAMTEAQREAEVKRLERLAKKRSTILDDILDRYESERCTPRGSAWAALNAVTESADYAKWGQELTANKDSRRFESLLVGERDDAKQVAVEYITAAMAK